MRRTTQRSAATNMRSVAINIVFYAKKPLFQSFGSSFRGGKCRYVIPNDSRVG
jgi:hypothetical protein